MHHDPLMRKLQRHVPYTPPRWHFGGALWSTHYAEADTLSRPTDLLALC
jgi:hypothetical protein